VTLLLTTHDISTIVATHGFARSMEKLISYIEADYTRWPAFDKSARVANHSAHGVIELMPVADDKLYSFKYVNGHPRNPQGGLPTVMAFGVLADVPTGAPLLVSELTLTTALRTAATSVFAARLLARKGATTMALIGNGAQSEFQALAFHYLLGIQEIHVFDVDREATRKLMRNLSTVPGLRVLPFESTAEAVRGVDIVTTVTADKAYATILTPDMVEAGMHLNAVGGDCPGKTELHADILRRAATFVEYEPQSRIEGEIQQMEAGYAVTELWQVQNGSAPGRVGASQITVFDSVGFALEDFSALCFLRDSATELGLGKNIDLIPNMRDPKDLYGQLAAGRAVLPQGQAA
jgi:ornithine cyclodeaminase